MSERKKIKLEKETEESKELLIKLRSISNENNLDKNMHDSIDFQSKVRIAMENLKSKESRADSIQILAELFRLSPIKLNSEEISYCFKVLLEILKTEIIDISLFISMGIPALLKDENIILKYLEIYPKSHLNREALREIISTFIENSVNKESLIENVLAKYEKYKDLVPRIAKLIDFSKINEDLYVQIVIDSQYIRESTDLRIIKGKKRFSYVEKLVEFNLDFALSNYIRDKDKRIRLLLAKSVTPTVEKYFNILLNDPDEDVRCSVISPLKWDLNLGFVADRVLDKSLKVRNCVFELFKQGCLFLSSFPNLKIFDEMTYDQHLVNGKLCFKSDTSVSLEDQQRHLDQFEIFIEKLCEGCLTGFSQEYLKVLTDSKLSLEFLCDHESLPGMFLYLESKSIIDLDSIKIHLKPCVLKYMFKGTLRPNQISDCITAEIFEVLKFIPDPLAYYSDLVEKAISLTDLETVEKIIEFLKPVLIHKNPIYPNPSAMPCESTVIDDSGVFQSGVNSANPTILETPNFYFLNAHTKTSELFNEQQSNINEYHGLYFQVYKLKNDRRVISNIKSADLTTDQKIKLLLYLNDPGCLDEFASDLICHNLSFDLQKLILETKNVTSTLIYFLCTGLVSVSNSSFFIKSIKACLKLNCADKKVDEKVKLIFTKYLKSVPQKTFDIFYSICWALKGCSTSSDLGSKAVEITECDESLIMNPMITENTNIDMKVEHKSEIATINEFTTDIIQRNENVSEEAKINDIAGNKGDDMIQTINENVENAINKPISKESNLQKVVLPYQDKVLHVICNNVIAMRTGELVTINFDPSKYGFYKMTDLMFEMIGHGQVTYDLV